MGVRFLNPSTMFFQDGSCSGGKGLSSLTNLNRRAVMGTEAVGGHSPPQRWELTVGAMVLKVFSELNDSGVLQEHGGTAHAGCPTPRTQPGLQTDTAQKTPCPRRTVTGQTWKDSEAFRASSGKKDNPAHPQAASELEPCPALALACSSPAPAA